MMLDQILVKNMTLPFTISKPSLEMCVYTVGSLCKLEYLTNLNHQTTLQILILVLYTYRNGSIPATGKKPCIFRTKSFSLTSSFCILVWVDLSLHQPEATVGEKVRLLKGLRNKTLLGVSSILDNNCERKAMIKVCCLGRLGYWIADFVFVF